MVRGRYHCGGNVLQGGGIGGTKFCLGYLGTFGRDVE